ncbi:MAG: NTP transferase domain-containing protein, partial [Desulfurococcales archaeon]|nr:NTP transferase domain-containing protein [Desulfurococcales archaeon]
MARRALVLLAAGRGERLRPITETRPKPLVPVLGESLLCRHIRLASKPYNPDEVVIVASYMIDAIREHLESRCHYSVSLRVIEQGGEKGTGHAILRAMEEVEADDYFIIYSDLYASPGIYES